MRKHRMKRSLEAHQPEDLQYASETSSFSNDDEIDLTSELFSENYTEVSVLSVELEELDMGKKPFFKSGPPEEQFTEAVSCVKLSFSHKYSTWIR